MPTAIVRWPTRIRLGAQRAYISFMIARDGSVSQVTLDRSSGSPTWDTACVRAAQRVDTFGAAARTVPREQPDGFVLL